MKSLSLNGKWTMTGGGYEVEGNIPGSLYSFLLDAGLMENPHWRDNEFDALALTHNDYIFRTSTVTSWNSSGAILGARAIIIFPHNGHLYFFSDYPGSTCSLLQRRVRCKNR